MTADDLLDAELRKIDERDEASKWRAVAKQAQRENRRLREMVEGWEQAAGSTPIRIPSRHPRAKGKKVHTMVGLVSDTHTFEVVESERVGGLNEHNPEIGKARLVKLFEDTAQRWRMLSKWYEVPSICLCLMGDYLVNNEMHPPDSNEAVQVSPLTEMREVGAILKGGIEYLRKKTDADIHVPCVPGNHGRMGPVKRITKAADYSLEHFLHVDIAEHFDQDERVSVDAGLDRYKLVQIAGVNFLAIHGDPMLKGGSSLPASFQRTWQRLKGIYPEMDQLLAGHVHQAHYHAARGFVNGSLVGWNEYAHGMALEPEPPSQWGFLVSHERQLVGTVWRYWPD